MKYGRLFSLTTIGFKPSAQKTEKKQEPSSPPIRLSSNIPSLIAELSGEVTRRIKTSNTGRKRLGVCLTKGKLQLLETLEVH